MSRQNQARHSFRKSAGSAQRWNLEKEKADKHLVSRLFDARAVVGELQKSKNKFWQNTRIDLQKNKRCNHERYKKFFKEGKIIVCRYCGKKI